MEKRKKIIIAAAIITLIAIAAAAYYYISKKKTITDAQTDAQKAAAEAAKANADAQTAAANAQAAISEADQAAADAQKKTTEAKSKALTDTSKSTEEREKELEFLRQQEEKEAAIAAEKKRRAEIDHYNALDPDNKFKLLTQAEQKYITESAHFAFSDLKGWNAHDYRRWNELTIQFQKYIDGGRKDMFAHLLHQYQKVDTGQLSLDGRIYKQGYFQHNDYRQRGTVPLTKNPGQRGNALLNLFQRWILPWCEQCTDDWLLRSY